MAHADRAAVVAASTVLVDPELEREWTRTRLRLVKTDWEPRLRAVVGDFIARGEVPTPTLINRAMGWNQGNDINGRATKVRTEMLEAAGYRNYVSPRGSQRWFVPGTRPPEGWYSA